MYLSSFNNAGKGKSKTSFKIENRLYVIIKKRSDCKQSDLRLITM